MAAALRWAWIPVRAIWQAYLLDQIIGHDEDTPDLTIRRLQCIHSVGGLGAGVEEDVRVTTHDFINLTEGVFDDTWTEADFLAVETRMDTFWGQIAAQRTTRISTTEYRWYRIVPGVTVNGPPVRVVTKSIPGTASAVALPPQVAINVTERTALAKHWGRFYIPGVSTVTTDQGGRVTATAITLIANAAETLYETILAHENEIKPVVYSPRLQSALLVREVQVDDIYDIQRRRRFETTMIRDRRALAGT